jgi:hypothetical protein
MIENICAAAAVEYLPSKRTKWYSVQLPDLNHTNGCYGLENILREFVPIC